MTLFRLGGALLAAATLLSTVLTGSAGALTPTARAGSMLTLTVEASEGFASAVRLRCHPAGGSHPQAKRACRVLTKAGGDFDRLPGRAEIFCTMEYRPVMATARGTWHGHPVRWRHEFSNPCSLLSATGVVFDF